jgi:SAM-dependent methyltransferase
MAAPADWQLPKGVSRAVWDYAHDCTLAEGYDAELAGTPLLEADLKFVMRHLRRPGRVLDLGCGTGRATIPLAHAGHQVVGIDLSQPMLAVARRKANDAGALVDFACGNIVDLSAFRDESFDAAVCLFSTLGMIAGRDARLCALIEALRVARPNGLLILHVHQLGHHFGTSAGRGMLMCDALRRLLHRPDAGDFPMPARHGSPAWTMHLFTRREISRLVRDAGFVIDEMCAVGIDGQPCVPTWRAYGLLVAARRLSR